MWLSLIISPVAQECWIILRVLRQAFKPTLIIGPWYFCDCFVHVLMQYNDSEIIYGLSGILIVQQNRSSVSVFRWNHIFLNFCHFVCYRQWHLAHPFAFSITTFSCYGVCTCEDLSCNPETRKGMNYICSCVKLEHFKRQFRSIPYSAWFSLHFLKVFAYF